MQTCFRLIVASLLASSLPVASVAASGDPGLAGPSIVGGTDAPEGRYPFLVSVQLAKTNDPARGHWCGGSLIAKSWVLTAAHCVSPGPTGLTVRVGQTNLADGSGKTYAISAIHSHRSYMPEPGHFDVALLKLATPVEGVQFIDRIGSEGVNYEQAGRLLTVAGWGALKEGAAGTTRLQHVAVPFIKTTECQAQYEGRTSIHDTADMCASQPGKDACQGDSGGPLFAEAANGKWVLLGAVSRGIGCAQDGSPGVYARLADPSIIDFIKTTLAGN